MNVKNKDAGTKQCPFIMARFVPKLLCGLEVANDTRIRKLLACGGTDCMAWREYKAMDGTTDNGFCGLVNICPESYLGM